MSEVTIFTRSDDPNSDMIRNLLKFHNIEFVNKDIMTLQNLIELKKVSARTITPTLVIDGKVYIGFDREKIKEVLNIK